MGNYQACLEDALKDMGVDQSKSLPDIAKRCEIAGPMWQVLYATRYRELCSWSHIHMENILNAPGPTFSKLKNGDGTGLRESIARGITMVHFSWSLIYLLANSLSRITVSARYGPSTARRDWRDGGA